MPTLPSNPNLQQLRQQARDLLRKAHAGEPEAAQRIGSVSDRVTLASAQLAIARGYGFPSWPAMKAEVEARARTLAEAVDAFLVASVNGRIGRAAQMLARQPEIARYDVRTAVVLGDAARVETELGRDPALALRPDPTTGWTALHAACASRWHVDPSRGDGLLAIVGLLLDAGADPNRLPTDRSGWSPLRCAVASAASGRGNERIIALLLERGAVVADHDLYLAGFAAGDGPWCLRQLLAHTADVRGIAGQALAAPLSRNDTEAVRVLLDAGADPNRYRDDDDVPGGVVVAAIDARCDLELIELLLDAGADPNATGIDGRSAYRVATAAGRSDLAQLLAHHGARDDATPLDRLQYTCLRGDRDGARRLLSQHPALRAELASADASALTHAAETGNTRAVELLLEIGYPASARGGHDGATALHAAAYAGSAGAVKRLLAAGAELEARDSTWDSTPLEWALVGSGERPTTNATADWIETVHALLDAGAATEDITLSPDDPKQPSADVAELLRLRSVSRTER